MQALAEGEQTNAFDGYDVRWEDEEHSVTCKHTLSHAEVAATLQVTAVDWFASASTIAVAYGRLDHEGWGTEKSFLCTWNLDMSRLNAFVSFPGAKAPVTFSLCLSMMTVSIKRPCGAAQCVLSACSFPRYQD